MKTLLTVALTAVITTSGLLACTTATTDTIPPVSAANLIPVKKTMKAFSSEQELRRYFSELAAKSRRRGTAGKNVANDSVSAVTLAEAPPPEAKADKESVTNTQHAGVDEGGIVKVHGDHLVVLRRGRLFTVAIGDGALKPISSVDAFGPEINPSGTWYDEMLVADNTVVVIGYSYERGGTEVGLFDISLDGYEIVEGRLDDGRMHELRRMNYAPHG